MMQFRRVAAVVTHAASVATLAACQALLNFDAAPAAARDAGADESETSRSGSDADRDGTTSGRSCDTRLPFESIKPLTPFGTPGGEAGPQLTADELRIVFMSDALPRDLYEATRVARTDDWGPARKLEVNTAYDDYDPALSTDGRVLIFGSARPDGGGGGGDLWIATRATRDSAFGLATPLTSLNTAVDEADPFVSESTKELLFSRHIASEVHIFRARGDIVAGFSNPELISELGDAGTNNGDVTLSSDGLTMYFASNRDTGVYRIWVTRRRSVTDAFGPAALVPELDSNTEDAPGSLSPDNCRLYFWSRREGTRHIYMAERTP